MKKYLLTLEKKIEEIETIENDARDMIEEAEFWTDRFYEIIKQKDLLQTPLTLSQFIPCDKDGNPIKKPIRIDIMDWDYQNQMDILESAYEAAKNAVVFDGFELDFIADKNRGFIIANDNYRLGFYFRKDGLSINLVGIAKDLKTFSDLAKSTQSNPLTIKP